MLDVGCEDLVLKMFSTFFFCCQYASTSILRVLMLLRLAKRMMERSMMDTNVCSTLLHQKMLWQTLLYGSQHMGSLGLDIHGNLTRRSVLQRGILLIALTVSTSA